MVTFLGSRVQSCRGEGGTLQTNIPGVCGECSQCLGHTGFPPAHCGHAFPVYTAQAPGCSAGILSKAGPGFCALPQSKPLRFRFLGTPQRCRLSWACVFCLPWSEHLKRPGAWWTHSSGAVCLITSPAPTTRFWALPTPVCHVSLVASWSLTATLPADVNCSESQKVFG